MTLASKMKYALILVIAISAGASIWFILGSTSAFNRSWDLIETVIFFAVLIPTVFFCILAVAWVATGFKMESRTHIIPYIFLVVFLLLFSSILFLNATPYGWLKESVTSDWTQITADERFKYRLEVVNPFQRNSHTRLHLVERNTKEEIIIPTDLRIDNIGLIGGRRDQTSYHDFSLPEWMVTSVLTPTETENIYILTTTSRSGVGIVTIEIDIIARTASRIE